MRLCNNILSFIPLSLSHFKYTLARSFSFIDYEDSILFFNREMTIILLSNHKMSFEISNRRQSLDIVELNDFIPLIQRKKTWHQFDYAHITPPKYYQVHDNVDGSSPLPSSAFSTVGHLVTDRNAIY